MSEPLATPPLARGRRRSPGVVMALVTSAVTLGAIVMGWLPPGFSLIAVVAVVTWLVWQMRAHAAALMLVFLCVALVGTIVSRPWLNLRVSDIGSDGGAALAESWAAGGTFDERLPVVLHLVFDELMSPGGIEASLPGGGVTRDRLYGLADTYGFRVYDSIYSRFYYSGVSLPNLLHAEYLGRDEVSEIARGIGNLPADAAYFADFAGRGYRTAVFQSSVLDFCTSPHVQRCETFPSFDPAVASGGGLDERTRTVYLWDTFFRAYDPGYLPALGRWVIRYWYGVDQRELGVLGTADRFDVQGFSSWFDRLGVFVTRAPRGSHVFAHLLVPHAPYLLTDGCVVSGEFDAGYALRERFEAPEVREQVRHDYYGRYLSQVRCVMSKVESLLDEMQNVPALQDAVIVIHGDHGSRISSGRFVEGLTPRDLVDNYATFFAVRSADVPPGIDCDFTSLPQVFRRVMNPAGPAPDGPPLPVLVLSTAGENVRVAVPMPRFGCAAEAP